MTYSEGGRTSVEQAETEFDHLDPNLTQQEAREAYATMRERCPVAHSARHGGFFHITRYDDVREVTTAPQSFSSADGVFIPPSGLPRIPPLEFDGDEHRQWRSIMQAPLTPAAVRELQPVITQIVTTQIDQFAASGEAELVTALAEPVPVHTIGRLVGLSAKSSARMRPIAKSLFDSIGTEAFDDHMHEFAEFTGAEIADRRRNPRDDFLSQLAEGQLGDMELDETAISGVLVALLIGGHHSTASALSGLFLHIMSEPGVREAIIDDSAALSRTIEESLRLTTPLQLFARTATRDTVIGGVPVPEGSRLFVNYAAANRDPRKFDDGDQFQHDRRSNQHLAFGFGEHLCIGRHLARAELRTAAEELFRRLPDVTPAGTIRRSGLQSGQLMEITELPVTFTPEPSQV